MRKFFLIYLSIILFSCQNNQENIVEEPTNNSPHLVSKSIPESNNETESTPLSKAKQDSLDAYIEEQQYMHAYIVVVDTSMDYYKLLKTMYQVSNTLSIEIDTMNRSYHSEWDKIALPEDDEDEIYAGEYFPRRYPSSDPVLSIEYFDYLTEKEGVNGKKMAIVAQITDTMNIAKAILENIQNIHPKAFISESKLYMGCMH